MSNLYLQSSFRCTQESVTVSGDGGHGLPGCKIRIFCWSLMLDTHLLMLLHGPSAIHPRGVLYFPILTSFSAIRPRSILHFKIVQNRTSQQMGTIVMKSGECFENCGLLPQLCMHPRQPSPRNSLPAALAADPCLPTPACSSPPGQPNRALPKRKCTTDRF